MNRARPLVAAAVLISVTAGLAVVPGEATALSCESTWNGDLYQSESGDWYVLNAQRTGGQLGEKRVEIYRYSSDWTEKSVLSGTLDNTTTTDDEAPEATAFGPASGGGWWLETDRNGYYRVDDQLRVTETRPASAERPQSLRQAEEREVDATAVNDGWEVDGVYARYRGESGDIWAYGPDRVYRYTGWGQYTGQSHAVGNESAGCGFFQPQVGSLHGLLSGLTFLFGLLTGLIGAGFRRRYVAFPATLLGAGGLAAAFYGFTIPWPLSLLYWLPNPLIAALLATPAVALLWWLRRGGVDGESAARSLAFDAVLAVGTGGIGLLVAVFFLLR